LDFASKDRRWTVPGKRLGADINQGGILIKNKAKIYPPLSCSLSLSLLLQGDEVSSLGQLLTTANGYHLRHLGPSPPSHNNMRVEASIILGNEGRKKENVPIIS
jgi:hypothetical protein